MAQDQGLYDLRTIYRAADEAGAAADESRLRQFLSHPDSGVRYWGAIGFLAQDRSVDEASLTALQRALEDASPSVRIAAAKVLCLRGHARSALPVLEEPMASEHPWVALEAARAMFQIGPAAKPAVNRIEEVRQSLEAKNGPRRYRDFNYASFTGWALEWALINCEAATPADFD